MPRQIIIAEQHRLAAVFAEDQIQELIVASGDHQVGDVYVGTIENVLPSIDAAFVDIGNPDRNGFIHVSDLGPLRIKRNSTAITELVAPQQKVLVQVMKEPTGNKGPRLTGNLSFPGRYLVLMPSGKGVHLSSRIYEEDERNRLKSLAILIKPPQMGLLVRTEAQRVSEEAMIEDLELLKRQWEEIQQQYNSAREPGLLNRDDDFIQRVLRDAYSGDVNRIVTDSPMGVKRVRQYLQNWNKGQMPSGVVVDAHQTSTSIFEYFRINAAIRQAMRPRVDLPSGGYIVIEPTEALTVIDVNSGSFTQSATSRETVLWTNCEAATEIARQLRLRNIAGVIVVDFIDMESRQDQLQVLEHFNKALRYDKSRPQVAQLSELGLVELTRKRQGQSLYEVFGRPCPTCDGLGLLAHLPDAHPDAAGIAIDPSRPTNLPPLPAAASGSSLSPSAPSSESAGDSSFPRDRNGGRGKPKNLRTSPGVARRERFRSEEPPSSEGFSFDETPTDLPPHRDETQLPSSANPKDKLVLRDRSESGFKPSLPDREGDRGRGEGDPVYTPGPKESPTKLIRVEMSPIQQKVYSEMGLSPLILLEEPVGMGRDTVITVTLPGQTLPEPPAQPEPAFFAAGLRDEGVSDDPYPDDPESETVATLETSSFSPYGSYEQPSQPRPDSRPDWGDPSPSLFPSADTEAPSTPTPRSEEQPISPTPTGESTLDPTKQSPAASRRRRSRS